MLKVFDENVIIVANDLTRLSLGSEPICPQANEACRIAAVDALSNVISRGGLVLDSGSEYLEKYRLAGSLSGQPGIGDAFVRAVFQKGYNPDWATRVEIRDGDNYVLPEGFEAIGFDEDDHLWIAGAHKAGKTSRIVNAVDSDYTEAQVALEAFGIKVLELCADCLKCN